MTTLRSRWLAPARLLRLGAVAIVLGGIALAAAVVAFGMLMSSPATAIIGPPPRDLAAENIVIASASGASLHGWFVAGRPGGGAVVLMHGVRSNR